MSQIANVVDGEASESDSEVEIDIGRSPEPLPVTKGFVISGEAPESDDESKLSSPSARVEIDSPLHISMYPPKSPTKMMYKSLLHQKLWESNVSFRASLEALVGQTTELAVDKLTKADKTLLNVQESMRATNASLTLARARLKQIQAELDKVNCSSALPNVKLSSVTS